MIQRAATTQLGHPLKISAAAVRDALDPARGVARRNGIGGPAPSSVQAMIATARGEIDGERQRLTRRRMRVAQVSASLDQAVATTLAAGLRN